MNDQITIDNGVAVTGAVPMWGRIVRNALDKASPLLPPGSKIIEVGYGDGILTCYLAKTFGWQITGYDVLPSAYIQAKEQAKIANVEHLVDIRLVRPEETWRQIGRFDGVFIKTVLYNAKSMDEYAQWLDWVKSVLKPGGIFVNFENGKANYITYLYRKFRGRYYTDLCMYDGSIQKLYEDRFDILYTAHYGAISQFVAPIKPLYDLLSTIEERFLKRTPDNSYITALIGKKK